MLFRKESATSLDGAIERALLHLDSRVPGSENYGKALDQLIRLQEMKKTDKSSPLSKDTLAIVGGNLLGILMIIKHENVNVIASKAMSLLLRPR